MARDSLSFLGTFRDTQDPAHNKTTRKTGKLTAYPTLNTTVCKLLHLAFLFYRSQSLQTSSCLLLFHPPRVVTAEPANDVLWQHVHFVNNIENHLLSPQATSSCIQWGRGLSRCSSTIITVRTKEKISTVLLTAFMASSVVLR